MKIATMRLKIEGMHCSACAMNIDLDLEDLDGVKEARTSYAKQETKIEFDEDKIGPNKIIETIQKTGYTASNFE